jgi:UDPglucose--hexose-1-phosphate uridylyltransferase
MLLSKVHYGSIAEMDGRARDGLADSLKRMTARYDNLFLTSFPYSMGLHQKPTDGLDHGELHFHIHFYPPLLRSATVQKFMVGYELLAMPQRDITAELAAEKLRGQSEVHYLVT